MAENWTFATSGSLGGLVPVLQPRSGGFKQKNAPRMRMGGGFCAHSPPRSFSERAERPTRQLFHNNKNAEQFVARSMRTKGLVPTLPDGSQPRPQSHPAASKRNPQEKKQAQRAPASKKVAKEINKLSAEYIDNLQLQIQILEKEIEVTKLKSSNDLSLLRSSRNDAEVQRKKLTQRPERERTGILSLHTPQAMQGWLRSFFSRHARDPRVAPHRDSVLKSFRDNEVTGPDAATLSAQDLRDELKVCSLAVRKLMLAEIEAGVASSEEEGRGGGGGGGGGGGQRGGKEERGGRRSVEEEHERERGWGGEAELEQGSEEERGGRGRDASGKGSAHFDDDQDAAAHAGRRHHDPHQHHQHHPRDARRVDTAAEEEHRDDVPLAAVARDPKAVTERVELPEGIVRALMESAPKYDWPGPWHPRAVRCPALTQGIPGRKK